MRLADLIAGSPHNLVGRSDRATIVERHIVECDALARLLAPSGSWLDLGTGGGLPGLVLAWRFPSVTWTLLDATVKKVDAVAGFARELGLANVVAVAGRAERLARQRGHRGSYDGVVSRAVAPLPVLAELVRGFLPDGGQLVAMKGPTVDEELRRAGPVLGALHYGAVHTERLPVPGRSSWVVTMRAEGPPPAAYPRRDGIPKQQPLG